MDNSEKQQSANGRRIDDVDSDQISDGDGSANVSSSGGETPASANRSVTRRLTEIFVEDSDVDLLLQRSEREDGVIQWRSALDTQVMGACRADERLKPLLMLNVSNGVAEDGLLAYLSQHFEPSEVGMLARCLCTPMVSIRVGKINKQGTLLSPTSVRGDLCLTLLPTSDLRISFNGDNGSVEKLATLSTKAQCISIEIEEIFADTSGRSFSIKNSDGAASYFWCSEKSKLLGCELLRKMKDLLVRKPSLAELTGISESRLDCFSSNLRAYLSGSVVNNTQATGIISATHSDDSADSTEPRLSQSSLNSQKSSCFQQYGSQGSETNLIYQGCLDRRSSSFKEGLQKSLLNIRSTAREKLRRHVENHVPCIDSLSLASSNSTDASTCNLSHKDKFPEANGMNFLDVFVGTSVELPLCGSEVQVSLSGPSPFSPAYCWCPPVASALQVTKENPELPTSSTELLSLPPFCSLVSSAKPSDLMSSPKPLLNLAEVPSLDFPCFLPEPLVRLPSSQLIPTFTPFICDPIVHIPVIDVCSSGQGYLASAGPGISMSIPPLKRNLVDPLLPNAESVVERSARETLRMLISSSNQPKPQLLEVFPSVLCSSTDNQNIPAAGSRGLYSGTTDVDAIYSSMSSMGLVLLSENSMEGVVINGKIDLIDRKEKSSSSDPSGLDEGMD